MAESQAPHPYGLGWDHAGHPRAYARLGTSGVRCVVVPEATAPPPAFSLSMYRHRYVEQGQAGTCWGCSGAMQAELSAYALSYESFPVCRRLVCWVGKQFEGGGNPTYGGNPTDALLAMTVGKGVGIAHEDLCPYTDDAGQLGTRPDPRVFDDAKQSHLVGVVDVKSNDDARRLIAAGLPCCNGMWWPYGFDNQQTFMTSIGPGTYGHALLEIGYVNSGVWDDHAWWQLDNWHGLLYPPLSAALAAKVPGYRPIRQDRTSDFWVRDDIYTAIKNYGSFEHVSATDLSGIAKKVVRYDFSDAYVF